MNPLGIFEVLTWMTEWNAMTASIYVVLTACLVLLVCWASRSWRWAWVPVLATAVLAVWVWGVPGAGGPSPEEQRATEHLVRLTRELGFPDRPTLAEDAACGVAVTVEWPAIGPGLAAEELEARLMRVGGSIAGATSHSVTATVWRLGVRIEVSGAEGRATRATALPSCGP